MDSVWIYRCKETRSIKKNPTGLVHSALYFQQCTRDIGFSFILCVFAPIKVNAKGYFSCRKCTKLCTKFGKKMHSRWPFVCKNWMFRPCEIGRCPPDNDSADYSYQTSVLTARNFSSKVAVLLFLLNNAKGFLSQKNLKIVLITTAISLQPSNCNQNQRHQHTYNILLCNTRM